MPVRKLSVVVLLAGILTAGVPVASSGAENVLEREDIETTYRELDKIIVDLEGVIGSAESALENVKSMVLEDGLAMTDTLFGDLKGKVKEPLIYSMGVVLWIMCWCELRRGLCDASGHVCGGGFRSLSEADASRPVSRRDGPCGAVGSVVCDG